MTVIKLDQVTRTYPVRSGTVTALAQIDLEISSGELVCICGPSGSGKTTLLLTIGGMLRPDRGEVHVLGEDLYKLSPAARATFRATKLGFVFQMFHLVPYLTVLENVLLPSGCLAAAERSNQRAAADGLIERLGLWHRSDHKPSQLSAGERQRAALARAMLLGPSLLLADEPTGNLDDESTAEVYRILGDYRDRGRTVLVVTHGPAALKYADRVIRLSEGGVQTEQTPVESITG
jgi:putative ABC transport system ATP-binding protein